jgi:hypothetical protein
MYNPEKQARAAGGKFGGKVVADTKAVEQAVETLATDVEEAEARLSRSWSRMASRPWPRPTRTINER